MRNRNQVISEQARRIADLEATLAGVRNNENVAQHMEEVAININQSDVSESVTE